MKGIARSRREQGVPIPMEVDAITEEEQQQYGEEKWPIEEGCEVNAVWKGGWKGGKGKGSLRYAMGAGSADIFIETA